jgi:hypothetical protein
VLDAHLPAPDAWERHAVDVGAPPAAVMAALWRADLGGPVARVLLGLRLLPAALAGDAAARARLRDLRARRALTLRDLEAAGFTRLAESPDAVVFGLTGRFWTPGGGLRPTDPATWAAGPPPGTAQAAWSFVAEARGAGGCRLVTETRVRCADAATRRAFGRYWSVVRFGSGLLRRLMLRRVRREAERGRPEGQGR